MNISEEGRRRQAAPDNPVDAPDKDYKKKDEDMDNLFPTFSFHAIVAEFAAYTTIRIRDSFIRKDRIAVTASDV